MPLRSPNTPRKPRILLVPPPELPVPAVQGGAVETRATHLIRENERAGKLDLLCASIPDPEAAAQAQGLQHTKMLYVAKPRGVRRYYPMVFLERCFGVAAPYAPRNQKVQHSLAQELPTGRAVAVRRDRRALCPVEPVGPALAGSGAAAARPDRGRGRKPDPVQRHQQNVRQAALPGPPARPDQLQP